MLNPLDPATGKGMLIFAGFLGALALVLGFGRNAWRDAALWLALAVVLACYGSIVLNQLPRLHRWLLILGLVAGGIAFWLAVQASFG